MLSKNKKVIELYEAGEYTEPDGTRWTRGMDGWMHDFDGGRIVWPHYLFVKHIEKEFPDE
ncbi:Hypothetical Protein OBI_RACECAR_243 [Arthrobacter phage Racecar]|nr:hypothetical protein PBI_RACECAR_35 [Arthrobacter phage Racecar]QFG12719.1 hypothetical protein PBI_MIMI_35 [Arthrobacter phage Mimi]